MTTCSHMRVTWQPSVTWVSHDSLQSHDYHMTTCNHITWYVHVVGLPLQTHWRKMCCSLLPLFSSNAALSEDIILDLLQLVHKGISNLHTSEEGQCLEVIWLVSLCTSPYRTDVQLLGEKGRVGTAAIKLLTFYHYSCCFVVVCVVVLLVVHAVPHPLSHGVYMQMWPRLITLWWLQLEKDCPFSTICYPAPSGQERTKVCL